METKRDDGRSGCGIVIKAVDTEKWITISKIAGASVLTEALDLLLDNKTQSGKMHQ